MRAALSLARRGLGTVWPNPAVGCVIVKDGIVVGRGWTQPGGRPHAETEALCRAGSAAAGACVYVTLEPCNHFGETPPCTKALLEAGVARVVTAMEDPDPRTAGGGHARLKACGVDVVTGVLADAAMALNAGFLSRVKTGMPMATLKAATTLDGKIAAKGGSSRWITGVEARSRGHILRSTHDAIMIGIGTAIADAPLLTCRIPGIEHRSPVRVVVDSQLRLPVDSPLVTTAQKRPTWILTAAEGDAHQWEDQGVEIVRVGADSEGRVDMIEGLNALGGCGITRLLIEGGGALAASCLRQELIAEIYWFRTGGIMGADGIGAVAPYGITTPADMARFERIDLLPVGEDVMEVFVRRDRAN